MKRRSTDSPGEQATGGVATALQRAAEVRRHAARARTFLPADAGVFAVDEMLQDVVAFNLMRAIRGAVDLAAYLLAERGLPTPETPDQAFGVLARERLLSEELAVRLVEAAELRYTLSHTFPGVDWRRVHTETPRHLESLSLFVAAVIKSRELPP